MSKETRAFRYFKPTSAVQPRGSRSTAYGSGNKLLLQRAKSADPTDRRPMMSPAAAAAGKIRSGAGDRCVAPAQSKPKRRETLRDMDRDNLSMHDSTSWTDEPGFTVERIVGGYAASFPVIAKVTKGFVSGRAGGEVTSFIKGQVFLVSSYGTQDRLLADVIDHVTGQSVTSISLPADYNMDVCIKPRDNWAAFTDKVLLRSIVAGVQQQQQHLPVLVHVESVNEPISDKSINLTGCYLRITGQQSMTYLLANSIVNGWVEQTDVVVIPEYIDVQMVVAVGMASASEQEWQDYTNMFDRAVRHVNFKQINPPRGILCRDPEAVFPSSPAVSSTNNTHQSRQRQAVQPYENVIIGGVCIPSWPPDMAATSEIESPTSPLDPDDLEDMFENALQLGQQEIEQFEPHRLGTVDMVERSMSNEPPPSPQVLVTSPTSEAGYTSADEGYNTKYGTLSSMKSETTPATTASFELIELKDIKDILTKDPDQVRVDWTTRRSPDRQETKPKPVTATKHCSRPPNAAHKPPNTSQVIRDIPVSGSKVVTIPPEVRTFTTKAKVTQHGNGLVKNSTTGNTVLQLNSVADIPSDINGLSATDVGRCLQLIGVDRKMAESLTRGGVDGPALNKLTAAQLTDKFHVTPFDAMKIVRFTRGWRPE